MLILCHCIEKRELGPLAIHIGLDDVLDGGRKVLKNLAQEIRPLSKSAGSRFFKVRIGKRSMARMIVFMVVEKNTLVPVLIRLKGDKVFGMNMSMNNPNVVEQLEKNFERVREDIEQKRFQSFEL